MEYYKCKGKKKEHEEVPFPSCPLLVKPRRQVDFCADDVPLKKPCNKSTSAPQCFNSFAHTKYVLYIYMKRCLYSPFFFTPLILDYGSSCVLKQCKTVFCLLPAKGTDTLRSLVLKGSFLLRWKIPPLLINGVTAIHIRCCEFHKCYSLCRECISRYRVT